MNKKIGKILIILGLALLGTGLIRVNPVLAQDPLEVIFEKKPLFNEANFLPGEGITRWIKITNNSGETKRIAIEAINQSDPNDFASQLNLTIKESGLVLYNDTLANFFDDGEVYLSDLTNGIQTQYDLTIVFNSGSGNEYQEKIVGFDILIGFQGEEGQNNNEGTNNEITDFRGSSGDILPPGLTISEESIAVVNTSGCQSCSATIIWTTSYFSTSEVIYDIIPGKFDFSVGPDKYGYAYIESGDDSSLEKVTAHSVTINDLLPNTDYYYRVVSHASPASISTEHKFFTYVSEGCVSNQIESGPSYALPSEAPEGQNNEGSNGGGGNITYQELEEPLNEEEKPGFLSAGLASIIDALRKIFGENIYTFLIFILLFLIILWLIFLLLRRKKKEEES